MGCRSENVRRAGGRRELRGVLAVLVALPLTAWGQSAAPPAKSAAPVAREAGAAGKGAPPSAAKKDGGKPGPRLTVTAAPGGDAEQAPMPKAAPAKGPPPAPAREHQRPTLPLSPTRAELQEMERRRDDQAAAAERGSQGRLPTQTGNTEGPGGRDGAGTSLDRKRSVMEGIGPTMGGVRRP